MNKQELIDKLKKLLAKPSEIEGTEFDYGYDYGIRRAIVLAKQLEEQEKLYTVEFPNPNGFIRLVLCKDCDGKLFVATFSGGDCWETFGKCKLTEAEIKEDFEWAWQFAKEVEDD